MTSVGTLRATANFLRTRRRDYQLAFRQPAGQKVLQDLAKFCRATKTTFHADPRIHAALEGRREVFLRILDHLNLTEDELLTLYSGHQFRTIPADGED